MNCPNVIKNRYSRNPKIEIAITAKSKFHLYLTGMMRNKLARWVMSEQLKMLLGNHMRKSDSISEKMYFKSISICFDFPN